MEFPWQGLQSRWGQCLSHLPTDGASGSYKLPGSCRVWAVAWQGMGKEADLSPLAQSWSLEGRRGD